MRDRAKVYKIKLPHKILPKGSSIPHEYYNTRNELLSSPFEVRREKWCSKSFAQVQQVEVIHLFSGVVDDYTRLRFLYGYEEQSTYSSADFAKRVVKWF